MLRFLRGPLGFLAAQLGYIPRGTRVDPAQFPEDEYPVQCLRCGYDLRGLPDGRCPECGEELARGRLLVELYARCRRPRTNPYYRIAKLLVIVSIATVASVQVAFWTLLLVIKLAPQTATKLLFEHDLRPWLRAALVVTLVGTLATFAAMTLLLRSLPPARRRKAVRQAARRR